MVEKIDFEKMQGLAPAIVQDEATGEVLMLGYMNREALRKTGLRLRDFFQPHARPVVDQGGNLRQPSEGHRAHDRL